MGLTFKKPTPEQEKKILKRLRLVIGLKIQGWDQEDDIGFAECYTLQGNWVQWQIRKGKPYYAAFRKDQFEYSIESDEILARLQVLTNKAIKRYRKEL